MASALVVLASAIAFSACTSASQEKYHLEERVPGESFSFHCSTTSNQTHVTLYKGNKQSGTNQVLHLYGEGEEGVQPTYEDKHKNRVTFSGALNKLTVNITRLIEEDSGIYWCQYTGLDEKHDVVNIKANEIVALLVKRSVLCPEPSPGSKNPNTSTNPNLNPNTNTSTSPTNFIVVLISIITAVVVFLMFAIMLAFFVIPKIKKLKAAQVTQNRGNDSVYEVMSTLR